MTLVDDASMPYYVVFGSLCLLCAVLTVRSRSGEALVTTGESAHSSCVFALPHRARPLRAPPPRPAHGLHSGVQELPAQLSPRLPHHVHVGLASGVLQARSTPCAPRAALTAAAAAAGPVCLRSVPALRVHQGRDRAAVHCRLRLFHGLWHLRGQSRRPLRPQAQLPRLRHPLRLLLRDQALQRLQHAAPGPPPRRRLHLHPLLRLRGLDDPRAQAGAPRPTPWPARSPQPAFAQPTASLTHHIRPPTPPVPSAPSRTSGWPRPSST